MEVGKIAAKFGGGSEKETSFVSKHNVFVGRLCLKFELCSTCLFVIGIILKWTVLFFFFF